MKTQTVLRAASVSLACIYIAACSPPQAVSAAGSSTAREICNSCGVVQSISPVTQEGSSTGAGAVIGAVVGGVAGNQVGGGSGKDIATAAGVVGGALLGNTIEQNRNNSVGYEVVVTMQDGSRQLITVQDPGSISPGSAVNVNGSSITLL